MSESKEQEAPGRVLALDIGTKTIGAAVSDELRLTVRTLRPIPRRSWKRLLEEISRLIAELDARALVIGLPLRVDGSEGTASGEARRMAEKFRLSLSVPVHLQDERLTTFAATETLIASGANAGEIAARVDSGAAAIILQDFLNTTQV